MVITKLLCSDIRQRAMLKMLGDHIRASDVEASSSSNFIQAIRPLIKAGFVERDGLNSYSLTGPGRILALQLREMIDAVEVLQDAFWRTHRLDYIPDHLLYTIGALKGGGVVAPNSHVTRAQVSFIDHVTHAKKIFGASSIYVEGYPEMISAALDNGAEVELILTQDVIGKIDRDIFNSWLARPAQCKVDIREVKAAFAVADGILFLGMFDYAGVVDLLQEWVCESERAAEWGRKLFEYYLGG